MSAIPSEIVAELKTFPAFHSFHDSELLLIAPLFKSVEFSSGKVLVAPNQLNSKLYFLRSGIVEVLVHGEKISEVRKSGEAIGELSGLSGKPVTTLIRAQSAVRCLVICAEDFATVAPAKAEQFQLILYKIYVSVLTERISQVNEKAKLYEFTARELLLKRRELEGLASAQMNFLRSEIVPSRKKVLLLEPNKKQQNIIKTSVGGAGVEMMLASTIEEGKQHYSANTPDLIFCESSLTEFLFWAQQQSYPGECVLIESDQIDFNRLSTLPFVQNVISRNPEDRVGTAKSILTSLSKILHEDYFGIEKYLAWGTEVQTLPLTGSKDRSPIKEQLVSHFEALGIRGPILDRVKHAAEEMMMNAVYDAPVDAEGTSLFNHLPRTTEVQLTLNQQPRFRFGCDGNVLAISTQDPYGSLPRYVIINYLESCYANQAGSFNEEKGGAGRGLHQILESCDWTIFNIKPGECTEVIGLFSLDQKQTGFPQFHYFFLK